MATKITPLDVQRAKDVLSKLSASDPGYAAALEQYRTLDKELTSQILALQQAQQSQKAATKTASQAKSTEAADIKNRAFLDTVTKLYQESVNLGQPNQTYKTEIDKLNRELGNTAATPTASTPAGYTNPTPSKEITDRYTGMATGPANPKPTGPTGTAAPTSGQNTPTSKGKKTTKVPPPPPALTPDDFMAKYGVQAALINSDPELKKLFNEASKNSWTADKFASQFLNTNWSKTHAETWQAAETARLSAPATYAQSYNNMRNAIARLTGTMGETLTPDQLGKEVTDFSKPVDRNPNDIVQWALDQSWGKGADTAAIKQHIAELGKINLAMPGGETANTMMTLKQFAGDMGMGNLALKGGTDYFSKAAESMLLGKSTIDTWKNDILSQAKTRYSAFAPAFDSGQTLRTVSAPYLNSIANLLEVPVDQIDLSSSTGYGKMVTDALTGTDPANPKPTALYDFQKAIKNLPEWGYTNNARDSVMPGVHGLLQLFGKVGA